MSVTFHIQIHDSDYVGSRIYCTESEYGDASKGHGSHKFSSYEEACAAYSDGVQKGMIDRACCGISPIWSIDIDTLSVNLSNSNANELLDRLGFRDVDGSIELCGESDPDELLGRILIARAIASDIGIPPTEFTGPRGARLIDAGRPEGYFDEKFSRLESLATTCKVLGRNVVWI